MKSQPPPTAAFAVPFSGRMSQFYDGRLLATLVAGLTLFTPLASGPYAAGATTRFTTLEAEAGTLGGGATIRSFALGSPVPTVATLELEASGGALVELTHVGDAVSWITPVDGANTIVVRSSIPDAPNGGGIISTLNLHVGGVFLQELTLTSQHT